MKKVHHALIADDLGLRFFKLMDASEVNSASPDFAREIFAPSLISAPRCRGMPILLLELKGQGTHPNFAAESLQFFRCVISTFLIFKRKRSYLL